MKLLYEPKYRRLVIPLVVSITGLVMAFIFESRSFIIGYTASFVFIFLLYRNFKLSKRAIYSLSILLPGILAVLIFFFKSDSSLGRLFIYKISFRILRDHFVSGIGWGQFTVVYNQYQASYFQAGQYSMKELLLADNVQYAYNDYLQFVIETGIAGLGFLILLAASIVFVIIKTCRKFSTISFPVPLAIAITQVIAIGTTALFRYVYSKPFFLFVFVAGLVIIVSYYRYAKKPWLTTVIPVLLVACIIGWYHYGYYLRYYHSFKKYEEAKALYGAGYINEALPIYKSVYTDLWQDVLFTGDYATVLINTGNCKAAIKELERLRDKTCNTLLYTQLGRCYVSEGRWSEAEKAYLQAVYMVPNRFITRYHLFEFYYKTHQINKAIQAGRDILTIPVKVPSVQVTHIKASVQSIMKDIN